MSFNMLAMLYMQAAQSKMKRPAFPSKKRLTILARRVKSNPSPIRVQVENTANAETLEVKRKCRVCGGDGAISIFHNEGHKNIVSEISTIANVEIKENDGLPSHICTACLDLLNNALIFKRRCEKMDKELRTKLKEMERTGIKKQKKLNKIYPFIDAESLPGDFGNGFSFWNDNETFIKCDYESSKGFKVEGGFVDCIKCCRCFFDKEDYISHLATCDLVCEKLSKEKQETVCEEFPWLCDFCAKVFKQQKNLLTHRMLHTDELPFQCELCPYRGRNKEILTIHTRVHTGERPYKCPHCPRAFMNISNRRRHMTVHESRPQHTCSICGKGLTTARALHDHEKAAHFNEKPYECDICGKFLSTKIGLRKHKFKVHKKRAEFATVSTYLRIDEKEKQRKIAKFHDRVPKTYNDNQKQY